MFTRAEMGEKRIQRIYNYILEINVSIKTADSFKNILANLNITGTQSNPTTLQNMRALIQRSIYIMFYPLILNEY